MNRHKPRSSVSPFAALCTLVIAFWFFFASGDSVIHWWEILILVVLIVAVVFLTPNPPNQETTKFLEGKAIPDNRANDYVDIDSMNGHLFEHWCGDLLIRMGFQNVSITQGSNDQGVDIIAFKNGEKYAIQCKRYTKPLGNKPIQEVASGRNIYGCNRAIVITNNYFTDGAKKAASANNVELWDRDKLDFLISIYGSKNV